jgi:hypothetical protein
MNDLVQLFNEFFANVAGQAALAVLIVGLLDFALGVAAAIRDKVFTFTAIDAWLRSNVAGRIAPLWMLLVVGFLARDLEFGDIPVITTIGIGAAATYVLAVVAKIAEQWGPGHQRQQGVPGD